MNRSTIAVALFLLGGSVSTYAACEASPTVRDISLSPEKLLLRSRGYMELCLKAQGALFDGENTLLHGRLNVPGKEKFSSPGSSGPGKLDPKVTYGATPTPAAHRDT
jgi:hypothetical protein